MPEGNTGNTGFPAPVPGNPFGPVPAQRPRLTRNKGFRSRLPNSHNNGGIQLASTATNQSQANIPNPFALPAPMTNNTVIEPTEEELAAAKEAGINPFDTEKLHDYVPSASDAPRSARHAGLAGPLHPGRSCQFLPCLCLAEEHGHFCVR